jgi:ribosomal protein L37AE/L43A
MIEEVGNKEVKMTETKPEPYKCEICGAPTNNNTMSGHYTCYKCHHNAKKRGW